MAKPIEHWTQFNEGDTTGFYSCAICGASVQPMDCLTHIKWHEDLKRKKR